MPTALVAITTTNRSAVKQKRLPLFFTLEGAFFIATATALLLPIILIPLFVHHSDYICKSSPICPASHQIVFLLPLPTYENRCGTVFCPCVYQKGLAF
jgi:hypothetical protein